MKLSALVLAALFLSPLANADEPRTPPTPPPAPAPAPGEPQPEGPPQGPFVPLCSNLGKDISKDDAAILDAIKTAAFCWQAVQLAENCGTEEAFDFNLVNAAAPICQKEFESHGPTDQDRALLASMRNACDLKWKSKEGGQYVSMNAYCKLRAWLWMSNLTKENR